MDKVVTKLVALGIPGLVLLVAISATGLYGAAAITAALAALGPFGMIGGIATLGVIGLTVHAISEWGFDAIFKAVLNELIKQGYTVDSIKETIKNDKKYKLLSKSLKLSLLNHLEKQEELLSKNNLDDIEIIQEYDN